MGFGAFMLIYGLTFQLIVITSLNAYRRLIREGEK